ncbi:MAG: hypothetical protein UX09_C0054G0005 [Candidatus Uhrbacteria bacterium GW2011_GWE2_45_35]|uniref:Thioredoxin domain-containing protein n=2 Tax=Candidatus Uhriibacteriota TaxID=1752732 RepID=A0A0G1JDM1_9BACT|nr:MAG: hypothetical protein UW63_C0057G0002 [Candidatus Uhrbacteria bacterium GW2011_GWF2_44_350]KKU06347.1 MAG: hypothetical protein UX09_C0054G0005 [Candidatus Uhrbacteria bacterium GW2011_GWE2_45_35]HBR80378.1 disulfide bond formation protein DsbA [Candidatus Uhrbacteria bacterium]HCU31870.1 disulfide bond formation protein DsbA [Candidatus Uhrbacteria bacterium]
MKDSEESKTEKKKSLKALVLTVLILIGISLFIWRIFYFVDLIRSGQIADLRLAEAQEMSVSRLAATAAASASSLAVVSIAGDPATGSQTAPLTIVMFGDFGCTYSRDAAFTVRSLAYQYRDQVQLVYKDFPLTDLHPEAELAAEAAACANDQDHFWDMFDRLYQNQSALSRESLIDYARALNLDIGRFISCLDNRTHQADVAQDYEEGLALGVYGTPTFFLNGEMVQGAIPADFLRALIEKMSETQ